jgi:hypothetical protein
MHEMGNGGGKVAAPEPDNTASMICSVRAIAIRKAAAVYSDVMALLLFNWTLAIHCGSMMFVVVMGSGGSTYF